jgi:hypothetical protein
MSLEVCEQKKSRVAKQRAICMRKLCTVVVVLIVVRFREWGFVDACPWFLWRLIPGKLQHVPGYHEVWTELISPHETNRGI